MKKTAFAALAALFVLLPLGQAAGAETGSLERLLVYCDVDGVSEALQQGANPNWSDADNGESALHYAVQCESGLRGSQFGLAQALIEAGALVSVATVHGESVLERALLLGSEPTIELLLEAGADPHARSANVAGVSMPALARIVGNASAERALARHGAEVSASDMEAVGQWGWIANFARDIDHWMDSNAHLEDADLAESILEHLRSYFADKPGILAEIELGLLEVDPTTFQMATGAPCCGTRPAPLAARTAGQPAGPDNAPPADLSAASGCTPGCYDGYSACARGCGGGPSGIVSRAVCARHRKGCLNWCLQIPRDPLLR